MLKIYFVFFIIFIGCSFGQKCNKVFINRRQLDYVLCSNVSSMIQISREMDSTWTKIVVSNKLGSIYTSAGSFNLKYIIKICLKKNN